MSFKLTSDALHNRPSRPSVQQSRLLQVAIIAGFVVMVLILLDLWLTDGAYLKYVMTDGMRPFRTMLDGLRVKGL